MALKKNSGPMLFCEWVIGGPLPAARRARQPKPPKPSPPPPPPPRDVIRVEVTTDDEKEEDTLKITFPRSGRAASPAAIEETTTEAVVKKVRFEEGKKGVKKSAMKQLKNDESDSSATLAESSSDGDSSDASSKDDDKKDDKKGQASSDESESDGEPHPTCKCSRCVKRRKKSGKEKVNKAKECESDESAATDSASEDEKPKKKESKKSNKNQQENQQSNKKDKNKGKKKESSDTDDEAAESGKETTDEEKETKPAMTKAEKKKAAAAEKNKKEEKTAKAGQDEKSSAPASKSLPFDAYPSAFPGPHARRPNLIAPIRAQVVQTEDVVETPDDPPPNAFYDAAANIMRVYYGPVYGNHNPQSQSLYPRREAAGRPLPVGMPHPLQNPYYHGFQNVPGYDQNGMPVAGEWNNNNGAGPFGQQQQPGFPPLVVNPMFQQQQQCQEARGGRYTKGAFSRTSPVAAPAPSVSQADDKTGGNNVLPTSNIDEKKTTSPYYTPSKTATELRNNSHRSSPARSVAAGNDANTAAWDSAPPPPPAQDANITWGDGAASTTNNNTNESWGNDDNNNGGGGGDNTTDAWPATDSNNNNNASAGDAWENSNNNNNNNGNTGGGDAWSAAAGGGGGGGGDAWEAAQANSTNVMPGMSVPGSWDSIAASTAPAWGDTGAAQSTGGAADIW